MLNIAIIGPNGRMGKVLLTAINQDNELQLMGTISKNDQAPEKIALMADILIDFTLPDALSKNLELAYKNNCAIVVGTTGLKESHKKLLEAYSKKIPLFYSPNFSLGISLMKELIKKSISFFEEDLFIDIIEAHHHHKKDKPSGTALFLFEAAGKTGSIHSIRAPNIVGEHSILFSKEEESIEIKHKAKSRSMFAKGALTAAKFLKNQEIGYYTMEDLIKDKNGKCLSRIGS